MKRSPKEKSFSKAAKTRWLSSDSNELCDRLKLILQGEKAGKTSIILNEEIIAIA